MNEENNKKDLSKEELSKLSPEQVQQMIIDTIKEIVDVSKSAVEHINQLDEYRKRAEQVGEEKIATELGQVVESTKSHLAEGMVSVKEAVEEMKEEDSKTLSIFNKVQSERGKALSETLSYGARAHDEYIQAKRDERYEKMIEEAGEIENPTSRLKH